jgi:hypothetical protein
MYLRFATILSIFFFFLACGDSRDPAEESPTAPITPSFALITGSASISGSDSVTTGGDYFYYTCLSGGLAAGSYYIQTHTSKDGPVGYGPVNYPSYPCRGDDVSVSWQDSDFEVWAEVYNVLQQSLGTSDTLYVTVDITPPPLSASITGDEEVAPDEECGWQAWASGGVSPYSYDWWGALTGSSQTIYGELSESSYLWVEITDSSSQADTAQIFVDVGEQYECDWR